MKKIFYTVVFFLILLFQTEISGKPRVTLNNNPITHSNPVGQIVTIQRIVIDANNIRSYFQNTGIFNHNSINSTAGFEWVKNSNNTACYTAGLSIGCYINDSLAQVMASYKGEYAPGYWNNAGVFVTNPDFKIYSVRAGDNELNNPDYANWDKMVPFGAPYVDINNNGQFDPGVDKPGIKNAGQTAFLVMTDGDPTQKNIGEGFGGGIVNPVMKVQVALTIWAYNSPGLEDLQFVNWEIINRGSNDWEKTYFGVVVDPDLGEYTDDYIGCDTTQNLGYCYNGTNNDPIYGNNPPAFGMDYFKSPVNRQTGDTLGLSSFVFFTNTGSVPIPCEEDPNGEPSPAYKMLTGVKKDGSPFLNPLTTPPSPTKFVYPGDPATNAGWTELKGSVQNCGGTNGTVLTVNPVGDRRFIFNSGADDFVVSPNDTQNIVLAQFVARGNSNLNSVTLLKRLSETAQKIYDANFEVTPPPTPPVVTPVFIPTVPGQCNITLNWTDASESYRYWDSVFFFPQDSNIYEFQGYEIYEINKFGNTIPNFNDPLTISGASNNVKLVAIYDIRDNIGSVVDTFFTGVQVPVNGTLQDQFAPFPVLPPYSYPTPSGFPNTGIFRSVSLSSTQFPENYGGVSAFVYGQTYQFAVMAYAVSKSGKIRRGFRLIRNSLTGQTVNYTPVAPPIGTTFEMKNNDTLNTDKRDLGVMPIIKDQNSLLNAKYRVLFGSTDTTYRVIRQLAGNTTWDTLKRVPEGSSRFLSYSQDPAATPLYLKFVDFKSNAYDSSRIVDGVYINVQKIRFTSAGGGTYSGNVGIIKDPSNSITPDSIQTRRPGWEYRPAGNQFVTGSQIVPNGGPWQSQTMAISSVIRGTWNNVPSNLTPDRYRTIRLTWKTNLNDGQLAYRYVDTAGTPLSSGSRYLYRGFDRVPFIAEEIDPTDSTPSPRRINVGFVKTRTVDSSSAFNMSADSTGGFLFVYFFNSDYSETVIPNYTTGALNLRQQQLDIMYVWAPRLITPTSSPVNNDELIFYPYTVTRPFVQGNIPLTYEFETKAPVFGNTQVAKDQNEMEKIRVVPNP
ncbi:MAG: hypothetical protein IAE65_12000, partial [Ignavibacteria bacterium]|nr:hypothetical protein [Ignavibacteria bacterium]